MTGPAVKVEIAFDSNFTTPDVDRTWTDVSAKVYGEVGITWGRTDRLNQVEPESCTVTLDNTDGDFTAGNPGSTYYPNIRLDRPIRVTVTPPGGSDSVRFTGYVNTWPNSWPLGTDTAAYATVSAVSRTGRLALRNAMQSMVVEDAIASGATAVYPLHDPSGSTTAEDVSGSGDTLATAGPGAPVSFGGDGVEFAGGQYLTGDTIDLTADPAGTWACSFVATTSGSGTEDSGTLLTTDTVTLWGGCKILRTELEEFIDRAAHRFIVARSTGGTVTAEIDGNAITAPTLTGTVSQVAGQRFVGTLRDLAYWPSELTSPDRADDFTAFNGGFGDTSDAALERIAGYAGIPSAEVDADTGSVVMGGIDTAGMAVMDALRVVETTEGGTLIDSRNGDLRLIGRRARYYSVSALTLDMEAQEVDAGYEPLLDRSLLRNDMTGTNAASSVGSVSSGATIAKRAVNAASVAEYGVAGGSVEVAAADPSEAYSAASWIVANFGEPAARVPSLSVDLLPLMAAADARVPDLLDVFSGSRITVTNRPTQDSSTEADFFVEGGTETWSAETVTLTWNVSPIGLADSIVIIDDAAKGQIDAGNFIGY